MKELYRILKPGGMGIFQIPQDYNRTTTFEDNSITDPNKRAEIFGQYDHVRVYGMDYFDKLRSIGFQVIEENYTKKFPRNGLIYIDWLLEKSFLYVLNKFKEPLDS